MVCEFWAFRVEYERSRKPSNKNEIEFSEFVDLFALIRVIRVFTMTPARFQTIEEIFRAALDQEPDQIGAFLDTACEGDEVLRRKVEALLASRQRAGRLH